MKDDFDKYRSNKDESKLFSVEDTLRMIGAYVKNNDRDPVHVSSCHSAVAFWIANEGRLRDTDEIVLLGKDNNHVLHSILVRGNVILGDTELVARGIQTRYEADTGTYTTMHSNKSAQEISYTTLKKLGIGAFKTAYVMQGPEPDAPENTP